MNSDLSITSVPPADWPLALDLVFQHLPAEERGQRRANVLAMRDSGEIHPHSLLIAQHESRLAGAIICVPLPGASALFWPPQVVAGVNTDAVADALVRHALAWAGSLGAKIAQAMVPAADIPLIAPLLRCGFQHITRLRFLRHSKPTFCTPEVGSAGATSSQPDAGLSFETYQPGNQRQFHETLERTYQGTLDCPELNGRRRIEEVVAGHQGQGQFRPELWTLAFRAGEPVGVVILAVGEGLGWEMSYVGVVPAARGQGIGKALAQRALHQAYQEGAPQLMVSVDARNQPAQQLYEKMGFVAVDEREVLLFFFDNLADGLPGT